MAKELTKIILATGLALSIISLKSKQTEVYSKTAETNFIDYLTSDYSEQLNKVVERLRDYLSPKNK